MTERPIIFDADSVRAILAGHKTQFRRVIKPQPPAFEPGPSVNRETHPGPYIDAYRNQPRTEINPGGLSREWCWWTADDRQGPTWRCPFGVPGDRLWVRETWAPRLKEHGDDRNQRYVKYKADPGHVGDSPSDPMDWHTWPGSWRSPILMPRWASRLTLKIADIRVQRLQDISMADAIEEGCDWILPHGLKPDDCEPASAGGTLVGTREHGFQVDNYRRAWNALDAKRGYGWNKNPWVWAVSFRTTVVIR